MALVRIYQKPTGTPANSSVFAVEIQQNNIWYTKKVSWEDLKGLIAGATSLVFNNGTVTFTTPDGVAHEVLSVDDEVLAASGNPVTGGAVSTALAGKQDTLTFDQVPTDGSTNPVESNGIYDALAGKQDTLTFDTTPTDGSTNPVTSAGIYTAISAITTGIDWKEAVPTYADIATTYPNPQDGWTVTTLDDDHSYRYNGTQWVDLFSLITLATSTKDGLMSSADFTKLSGIEAGANNTTDEDITDVVVDLTDTQQTASANPITLETKQAGLAKSCVVEMNPIQNLHGFSNPWAGGAGKNKVKLAITTQTISDVILTVYDDGTFEANGTASADISLVLVRKSNNPISIPEGTLTLSGCPSGGSSSGYMLSAWKTGAGSSYDTGSGISFNYASTQDWAVSLVISSGTQCDHKIFKPMVCLSTASEPTVFAPYSNICPIIGRTETNILQGTNSTNMYTDTGVTPFNSTTTGVEVNNDNSIRVYAKTSNSYQTSKQLLSNYNLENGKKYAIFADVEIKSGIGMIAIRNSANAVISEPVTRITTSGTYMCTFTMSSEANFLSFFCTWDTPNINADVKYTNIRFVEYEKLITKQFGQTVIGGRLDFENGGLDNEYELFEPTTVTTVAQSSGLWYWAFSLPKTSTNPLSTNGLMSSHFNPTNQVLAIGNCYITANGTLLLCVPSDQTLNTGALVNAWLAENDLQFAYKPATPTIIQLSPEALTLLKGLNVISTDGDKVQVEFSDIPVGDYSVLLDYIKSLEARIEELEGGN